MQYSDYNNTVSILTPESTGLNGDISKYESTGTYNNMQGGRRRTNGRHTNRRRTNGRHTNRRRTHGRHTHGRHANSHSKPPKSFLSFLDFLR